MEKLDFAVVSAAISPRNPPAATATPPVIVAPKNVRRVMAERLSALPSALNSVRKSLSVLCDLRVSSSSSQLSTLNSVKERGSHGALRSQLSEQRYVRSQCTSPTSCRGI